METYLISIDVAKMSFECRGVSREGKMTFAKRLSRGSVLGFMSKQSRCVVAMESCAGAHYWGREFEKLGFTVKLVAGQYVKPFVKTQKNDRADAEAIAEAALRPSMRFVSVKRIEQQDVQNLHRIRERLVRARTTLGNQLRGLLAEYGIVVPQGIAKLRQLVGEKLAEESEKLSSMALQSIEELLSELSELNVKIKRQDEKLASFHKNHPESQRLETIPGVGVLAATATIAAVTDLSGFRSGRDFAAWLGLVPRQQSTGGKTRLGPITKRGNSYLRKMLILGAQSVLLRLEDKHDDRSLWLKDLRKRKCRNQTSVALANKNARVIWALLSRPDTVFEKTFTREAQRLLQAATA